METYKKSDKTGTKMSARSNESDKPFVSVIVPVLNGEKDIFECLHALQQQEYPEECYEIIVVDNGSKDRTLDIIQGFKDIVLLENATPGAASSRNRGVDQARGEILLFIDSDCIADKRLVAEHAQCYTGQAIEGEISAVGGGIKGRVSNFWSLCDDYCSWAPNNPLLKQRLIRDFWPSANFSILTSVFKSLNGFNRDLLSAEDVELCMRIRLSGYTIFFQPRAIVNHKNRTRAKDVFKRAWNWARVDEKQIECGVVHHSPYPIVIQAVACLFIFFYSPLVDSLKVKRFGVLLFTPFLLLNSFVFTLWLVKGRLMLKRHLQH